jgi:hypothetical protein
MLTIEEFRNLFEEEVKERGALPRFTGPPLMRVYHTSSPCLEEGGA